MKERKKNILPDPDLISMAEKAESSDSVTKEMGWALIRGASDCRYRDRVLQIVNRLTEPIQTEAIRKYHYGSYVECKQAIQKGFQDRIANWNPDNAVMSSYFQIVIVTSLMQIHDRFLFFLEKAESLASRGTKSSSKMSGEICWAIVTAAGLDAYKQRAWLCIDSMLGKLETQMIGRMRISNADYEDYKNACFLGIMRYASCWNPAHGSMTTYFRAVFIKEISEENRYNGGSKTASPYYEECNVWITRALRNMSDPSPTDKAIADEIFRISGRKFSEATIRETRSQVLNFISLDAPCEFSETKSLHDVLPDTDIGKGVFQWPVQDVLDSMTPLFNRTLMIEMNFLSLNPGKKKIPHTALKTEFERFGIYLTEDRVKHIHAAARMQFRVMYRQKYGRELPYEVESLRQARAVS